MSGSGIRCYACGHAYDYLGRQPHPGRCPRCKSHCVSPAGALTTLATVDVAASSDPADLTVVTIDDRRRHFLYHVRIRDHSAELVALQVDGHVVQESNTESKLPVPPAVRRALAPNQRGSEPLDRHTKR